MAVDSVAGNLIPGKRTGEASPLFPRTKGQNRGLARAGALGLVLLVVAGGYAGYGKLAASPAPAAAAQVVEAQRGNLTLTVTASGTVASPRAVDLSFKSNGTVEEVLVQPGDSVVAGQPLARIETRSLEFAVTQAEIGLRNAQLSLESLLAGARPEDIASAEAAVESARAKLATMEAQGTVGDVAAAEAGLQTALVKMGQIQDPPAAEVASSQAAVQSAAAGVASAQAKLDQLRNPSASDLRVAENAVTVAQANLLKLKNPNPGDVAGARASVSAAEAGLQNAQTKLDQLRNPPQQQLLEAQSAVASAEIGVTRARGDLEALKQDLNDETIRNLVNAYMELYLARQRLSEGQALRLSQSDLAERETAVLLALRKVQAAEEDAGTYRVGVSSTQIVTATQAMARAEAELDLARMRFETLRSPATSDVIAAEQSLASAKASLDSAKAKLTQLTNPSASDITAAESAVVKAEADLAKMRSPSPADFAAADSSVISAEANLLVAKNKLELLLTPSTSDIMAANSTIVQAQQQLEKARAPYHETDFASQRASLSQAIASLGKSQNPTTAQELAKAQLTVDQARLGVDQAVYNLDQSVLRAPMDAVVSKVAAVPGGQSTSAAVSLIDLRAMQVQATVDESDVSKLQPGMDAAVTVDATGARPFRGRIISIAPAATVTSGIATYQVIISLPESRTEGGASPALRSGMTATANIAYSRSEGVLLVPNRAVKSAGGQRTVEVQKEAGTETREVKVGISDGQRTAIVEGLQEGEQIVVPATSASGGGGTARTQGPGGIPGAGFGGAGLSGAGGLGGARGPGSR